MRRKNVYLFGAWTFSNPPFESFLIGPVRFVRREIWVDEFEQGGLLPKVTANRIRRVWSGKKVQKRRAKSKRNELIEKSVLDAIGRCPWVCLVPISYHAPERAKEKTVIAARVAMVAIAICWELPSRILEGTGLLVDREYFRVAHTLAYREHQFVHSESSVVQYFNQITDQGKEQNALLRKKNHFRVVGKAIRTFLARQPTSKKAKLEGVLVRALVWLHEGCRERSDFLAIVKFGAALDVLSNGGETAGIRDLFKYRLGVTDLTKPVLTNGMSAEDLVKEIYSGGRSRIIHGTRQTLAEDLNETRRRAEFFAALIVRVSILWLGSYRGADDESAFRCP